ncbi:MAG: RusA family crossover junction endodeoxyribonuclease [Lactobacillus sp.]|nr:RusA family crossover junction endodeoxyribonuclease [Lactobacillus sp.]
MKLVINKIPLSQSRPRFSRRGGVSKAYDTKKIHDYKQMIAWIYREKYGFHKLPKGAPLRVTVTFYREIQKSISKAEHQKRLENKIMPIVKPDIDNYIKAVLDGLNGVAFADDNQIVEIHAKKLYSNNPRTEIEVIEI